MESQRSFLWQVEDKVVRSPHLLPDQILVGGSWLPGWEILLTMGLAAFFVISELLQDGWTHSDPCLGGNHPNLSSNTEELKLQLNSREVSKCKTFYQCRLHDRSVQQMVLEAWDRGKGIRKVQGQFDKSELKRRFELTAKTSTNQIGP